MHWNLHLSRLYLRIKEPFGSSMPVRGGQDRTPTGGRVLHRPRVTIRNLLPSPRGSFPLRLMRIEQTLFQPQRISPSSCFSIRLGWQGKTRTL
jgi:hypothetical protein